MPTKIPIQLTNKTCSHYEKTDYSRIRIGGRVICPPHHPHKRSAKALEIRNQGTEYPTSSGFGSPSTQV